MLPGAVKDGKVSSPDWACPEPKMHGVRFKEMKNILTRSGVTTEVFRADWKISGAAVEHVITIRFRPGALSAWPEPTCCHPPETETSRPHWRIAF